ncbi:MAG: hypothetical protein H7A14_05415 [Sinobacteraceae bacterium]|nr:hypothetical protein [Nevskiaceae bacterium]
MRGSSGIGSGRRQPPRTATRWPFALLCAMAAAPALAHSPFGADALFWEGAWHLFLAPLALAAVVGIGLACAGGPLEQEIELASLAGLTCCLVAWQLPAGPVATWLAPLSIAAVGLGAVLAIPPTPWRTRPLALLAGLGAGAAIELDTRTAVAAAGAGAAMLVTSIWMLALAVRLQRRWPVALRVAGAWIVALSLLLLALAMRGLR